MRVFIRSVVVAGIIGLAFSPSCANSPGNENLGNVGLQLQIAPGVTINTLIWTLTSPGGGSTQGSMVNEQFSNTISFQVGGLAAGTGYTMSLTASSVDGAFTCAGSAMFDISAGMTTTVGITLNCTTPGSNKGTVVVDGTTQICANVDSLSGSPLETTVNNSITLAATASAGSTTPSFAWTASAGTFDNAASATPVFTCPATPGSVTITVSAGPAGCPAASSRSVTVTCDTLNPTFTNVYTNIIGVRCIGCHHPGGSGVNVGMLDMSTPATAYASLVNVNAMGTGAGTSGVTCASVSQANLRVSPGNSAGSLLFEKVNSKLTATLPPCGSPMPLPAAGAPLTQAQVNLIAAWIDAGANND